MKVILENVAPEFGSPKKVCIEIPDDGIRNTAILLNLFKDALLAMGCHHEEVNKISYRHSHTDKRSCGATKEPTDDAGSIE